MTLFVISDSARFYLTNVRRKQDLFATGFKNCGTDFLGPPNFQGNSFQKKGTVELELG